MSHFVIKAHNPPAKRPVLQAAKEIGSGSLCLLPSDSEYMLACSFDAPKLAESIPKDFPALRDESPILFCSSLADVSAYTNLNQQTFKLAQRQWPGALWLELRVNHLVPKRICPKKRYLRFSVPSHPVLRALLEELGCAIVGFTRNEAELLNHFEDARDCYSHAKPIGTSVDSERLHGQRATIVQSGDEGLEIMQQGDVEI